MMREALYGCEGVCMCVSVYVCKCVCVCACDVWRALKVVSVGQQDLLSMNYIVHVCLYAFDLCVCLCVRVKWRLLLTRLCISMLVCLFFFVFFLISS